MDTHKTIAVLEALASGCSPTTGEMVPDESVLNERTVIRALQVAIDQLKKESPKNHSDVSIDEKDIEAAIQLFKEHQMSPTCNRLANFFLAARKYRKESITSNELYGKYKDTYQKGQLLDFFTTYLTDNGYSKHGKKELSAIDFFRKETFNNLSEEAIRRLKEKINEIGITKADNLPDYVQKARIIYPRSHESWTDMEKGLLWEAIQETNDLSLLSDCFQRGQNAIELCGQKLIYENQNLNGDKTTD